MTMTEYEILKKRIEEWNRGKGAEFQLQLAEAKEDYIDPDYGVFKKYGGDTSLWQKGIQRDGEHEPTWL